jgi:hypothetical protein
MKQKFFLTITVLILFAHNVFAQGCSVCTKTASELGDEAGNGLNKGIIYLALLPLSIILSIGVYWYRNQKAKNNTII